MNEEKAIDLLREVKEGKKHPNKAYKEVCILFGVSNSVKIALFKQLEALSDYIPAEIYTRKVIEIKEQFL